MEYACPIYHNSLPSYLSDELESLQKRAMRIIHPFVNYRDALELANLETVYNRRRARTTKLFQEFGKKPEHKLHRFLPKLNKCNFNLRNTRKYHVPVCKTNRLQKSFFTAIVYNIVVTVISNNNRIFLVLIYINKFLQILNLIQLILAVIFRIIKL